MQAIAKNIYIETNLPGVTLGVINTPQGLIQIDAPPSTEDGRTWRAALLNLSRGIERVLINLDSHPDRTLGVRTMECTTIAHEKTAQVFRSRPNIFKAQSDETGADWERLSGLGNIRWTPPEITFNQQMTIYWDDSPVILEFHPGPSAGASWVRIPDSRVVFVGDALVPDQPPFLANADIPVWIETLMELTSPAFRGYTIVSGRDGVATIEAVRAQLKFLKKVESKLGKMAVKKLPPDAIEHLVPGLVDAFAFPASRRLQYTQRMRYGLLHYYNRHFQELNNPVEEEE
jgi:glyoxylase-like metal-dependent hydrolase (beta-lactamase superfamily II)